MFYRGMKEAEVQFDITEELEIIHYSKLEPVEPRPRRLAIQQQQKPPPKAG